MDNNFNPASYYQLNDSNWLKYALKHYDNPHLSSIKEFEEDVKRFSYIISLLNKYDNKGILRERLLLNHITIVCNCFGKEGGINLLYFKIPKQYHYILNTIFLFLNLVKSVDGNIDTMLYKILGEL